MQPFFTPNTLKELEKIVKNYEIYLREQRNRKHVSNNRLEITDETCDDILNELNNDIPVEDDNIRRFEVMDRIENEYVNELNYEMSITNHNETPSQYANNYKIGEDILEFFPNCERAIGVGEDIYLIYHSLKKCESLTDFLMVCSLAYRLVNGNGILLEFLNGALRSKIEIIFELNSAYTRQSGKTFEAVLAQLRSGLDNYSDFVHCELFMKLKKVMLFCLTKGLLDKVEQNFNIQLYSAFEKKMLAKECESHASFAYTLCDLVLYVLETGYISFKLGSLQPFMHGSSTYGAWFIQANEIKRKSRLLSNPEPHDFDISEFLSNLHDCLDKGKSILKFLPKGSSFDRSHLGKMLIELQMIKDDYLTYKAASESRKPPFSVLVYGASNIGKSLFTQVLFKHFGKLFDKPTTDEYKFTVNPLANFWDNFETYKWCLILDDIASLNPNAVTGIDPSLECVIQSNNSAAFVPDQASLDKKGKTPFKGELMIATTNAKDLNCNAYFACPIAIRRRFKYTITLTIKDEYSTGGMLDSDKVPDVDGEYPDFWNIKVEKVVVLNGTNPIEGQMGKYKAVAHFNNIHEFLAWYGTEAKKYRNNQSKAMVCEKGLDTIKLCKNCCFVESRCTCPVAQSAMNTLLWSCFLTALCDMEFKLLFSFAYYMLVIFVRFSMPFGRVLFKVLLPYRFGFLGPACPLPFHQRYFALLGQENNRRLNIPNFIKITIAIVGAATGMCLTFKLMKSLMPTKSKKEEPIIEAQTKLSNDDDVEELNNIGDSPKSCDIEKPNEWKQSISTSFLEVPVASRSLNGINISQFCNILSKNLVHLKFEGKDYSLWNKALCVVGNYYLINTHFLSDVTEYGTITITFHNTPNSKSRQLISGKDIIRVFENSDLSLIKLTCVPPRKDIRKFFAINEIPSGNSGYSVGRGEDGVLDLVTIDNIKTVAEDHLVYLTMKTQDKFYGAIARTKSDYGDCGKILICESAQGPIICGIHCAGLPNHNNTFFAHIYKSFFDGIESIESGEPLLSAPGYERELTTLHFKSPANYVKQSSFEVYGSFKGFRPKSKSSVCDTLIRPYMEELGYNTDYMAPVMNGWEPWFQAFEPMVNIPNLFRRDILDACAKSYTNKILTNLKDRLHMVHVLDYFTAVNGKPGVTFIDSINRRSSMGCPWKKSKRFFLVNKPSEEYPDGVDFTVDVKKRIKHIIDEYKQRRRVYPTFCAHLKDEPLPKRKVDSKKTRVFAGAPADWSVVVRMYTLGITRLFQHYKFISEMAPGTQAQTVEWEHIFEYLTKFGEDRIIAGDYAKFDKKMSSAVILLAFDIIKRVCEAAGYSEEDLLILDGIAVDTSYALMDFNGDLVQFFGSNPSGHPLTVIINSLVNSIYVRYVYVISHPNFNSCGDSFDDLLKDFDKDVRLMTYGDDNIMNVHPDNDWFNHTVMQKAFASVGIEYTMAEKEAESVPFINIFDASFLKRKWVLDIDLEHYVCPLDEKSIIASLMTGVRSKEISMAAHSIAKISSAIREYFWYGRTKFERMSILLQNVVIKAKLQSYVEDSTFPSWEQLRQDYFRRNRSLRCDLRGI